MDTIEKLDEIEDLLGFNLSFGVSIKDSLSEINRLDLLDYYLDIFKFS